MNELTHEIILKASNGASASLSFFAEDEVKAQEHGQKLLSEARLDIDTVEKNFFWDTNPSGKITGQIRKLNSNEWWPVRGYCFY
jgi:hypothetical protein